VEIEIFPEATTDPEKQVLVGNLDLAIVSNRINDPNLHYKELFTDELLVAVHSEHPWTGKKYVQARDFANEHLIIHSYPLESVTIFSELLIPAGVTPKKVIPIQLTEAAFEMVKASMGVKVIAKWIIEPYLHDKRLAVVPITSKGLYRTWYAATLNKPNPPQYIENFIEHLRRNIAGICNCETEDSRKKT